MGRWVAAVLRGIWSVIRRLGAIGAGLAQMLFGELSWRAPIWLARTGSLARAAGAAALARPRRTLAITTALLAIAAAAYGAWRWYEIQPKPRLVAYAVEAPPRTELETEGARPADLAVTFTESAAALALVGKAIATGVTLTPAHDGEWKWESDRRLIFTPKTDWPIGAEFKVQLDRAILAAQVRLADHRFTFKTAAFAARIMEARLHQDPQNRDDKRIVATVNFSHPVDANELERRIVLRAQGQPTGFLGIGRRATQFTVRYDKARLNAFIQSEPIAVPAKDTSAELVIDTGVRAARGGPAASGALMATVPIPGLASLRITRLSVAAAENDRFEPDRVVTVAISADTNEREVAKVVSAWLLPEFHPDTPEAERKQPFAWNDPGKIGTELLREGNALKLTPIPAERENITAVSFKIENGAALPAGRYVYLKVEKGLKSFGGYLLAADTARVVRIDRFAHHARIVGAGSLLALSGERKLSVMARDVEGLRVEIGRVLPAQLQHLVTQNHGTFSQPRFNSSGFDESALVERFTQEIALAANEPGRPSYHAVDLARYLEGAEAARRGVFFVKLESYDPKTKQATGASDRRLVVVTDLGLLSKRAADGSHDVFVQSTHSGQPVAGAAVEIIGRNGVAVLTQPTDAGGRVHFDNLAAYQREREPVMIIARRGSDIAFLPIGKQDRRLDVSRYDVGGVDPAVKPGKLSAYLFSDRGLYRPGDEMRFGVIVKSQDWAGKLAGVPLEYTLDDPRGVTIRRDRIKLSAGGLDELRHTTGEVAPTGTYTLALHTVKDGQRDSQIGAVTVNVQEFQPDRLKMSVRLSEESVHGWVAPTDLKARVSLQNLFGTPAENRRVTARLTLAPQFPRFAAYRDYRFTDPQLAREGFTEELGETRTNERGEVELDLGLRKFARATYIVQVLAEGFEADGGRGVSAATEQLVSNMTFLVGSKAEGDLSYVARGARRSVELIAIDSAAKPVEASGLTLARIERRFVSTLVQQPNGTYKYESRRKDVELERKPFTIAAAKSSFMLATDQPGSFSYVLRDADAQDLARIDYTVAGAANLSRSLDKNAELQVTLAKRDLKPGEDLELSIVAPYAGAGLITIERERVFANAWFKTATNATTQRIRIPADLEGGAYVSVAFVRDPASDEIYASPLSYAVQPFSIALDRRNAKLTLETATLVKPGETLRIRHRADQPARAVVFAVDEGILQVARYQNADPLAHFFAKRALGVETAQILDLILPEFKRLMQSAAPGGGDGGEIAQNLNPFKRRRDPPVTFWSGLVDTGPQGGEVTFTVPDYFNGTLRVMAVAVNDTAVGATAEKTLVRGDFVLSPNLPATVTPGDEFEVSVGVSNNVAGAGEAAKVMLAIDVSEHLEVIGTAKLELAIGEGREGAATFRLRAKETLGSAAVTFAASLGMKSARARTDISVRPMNPFMTELTVGAVRDGKAEIAISRELHAEHRKLEASVSYLPNALSRGLAAYLEVYPHQCTEQLVSRALPALARDGKARSTIEHAIAMLRARQNAEGGFGLWAANHYVVPVVSVYAQHFLLEARERGHAIPADLLKHGNDYLRSLAASDGEHLAGERTRAYAIYLLTRQGQVTSNFAGALQKRLEENHKRVWREDIAAAYLAASYALMKQERTAEQVVAAVPFGKVRGYADYYDGLIHDAQLLYLASAHFPERARRLPAATLESMANAVQKGGYNTLSAAYATLAFDRFASLAAETPVAKLTLAEALRDGKLRPIALPAGLVSTTLFSADAKKLQIGASGPLAGFYAVTQAGFDRAPPTQEIKAGIEILREYVGADGKAVGSVRRGDEIDVRLRFRGIDRAISDVAIVDLLPGGFEIVPAPREDKDEAGWRPRFGKRAGWSPEYADSREDRIVLYGAIDTDAAEFVYRIKATNAGTFAVPPAYAEAMYETALRARSRGARMTVTK